MVEINGVVKLVPKPRGVPPVAAAYQLSVPTVAVAPRISVPGPVLVAGVVPVIVGIVKIVKVFVDESLPHPALFAVNVSTTLPAILSAALGVYVQVVSVLALAKVPVPLDVHNTEI